ncbi:MAG: hypothetical protein ACTSQ8_20855 [Candidatus Helarchaeota archaeon]
MSMINAIFIISASGGCVFYHEFKRLGGGLDQDLVSGFLVALQNFAKETFGVEQDPQKLDLAGDLRLVYSLDRETQLLGACVADSADHPKLVQKLIDRILNEFVKLFKNKLDKAYEVTQFNDFVYFVEQTINSRVMKRGILSVSLGLLAATLIIPGVFVPLVYLLGFKLGVDLSAIEYMPLLTGILFIIGGLPQILTGYIAGNRKLAAISAVIMSLIVIPIVILVLLVNLLFGIFISSSIGYQGMHIYYMFMPLILPENIALAYFGGYRREIKRLNPLKD